MTESEIGEQIVLYPGKLKWSLVSLTGLSFAALGVMLIFRGEGIMAWLITAFFGAVGGGGLLQLLGKGSNLTLDAQGFRVLQFGRDQGQISWLECSGFGTARIGGNNMVVYDRAQDEGTKMAVVNRALAGGSAALPDTYGMKVGDLATLMNAYRDKAVDRYLERQTD